MALLDAFILDAASATVWIALRVDEQSGSGTVADPFNGATRREKPLDVVLSYVNALSQEIRVSIDSVNHNYVDGDVVEISGITGALAPTINGTFGIYSVTPGGFRYALQKQLPADQTIEGHSKCIRLSFRFDEVMRFKASVASRLQLGPGIYQTRGFAVNDGRGWQPQSGQKIIGAGIDVTTLQLVGAENCDQHYHLVGTPIEPFGTTALAPLATFEISDMTLDCNVDNQPVRLDRNTPTSVSSLTRASKVATASIAPGHDLKDGDLVAINGATGIDGNRWNGIFPIGNVQSSTFDYIMTGSPSSSPASGSILATKVVPYPNVACGAVRIMGNHCRIARVKAINFGTKSFKQGCFVFSIIQSSGRPTGPDAEPIITECNLNGISDCIAIVPSKNNIRETTVLHIGGLKNLENQAQGFGRDAYIRNNFVDCQFYTSTDTSNPIANPFPSVFITSKAGTVIGADGLATFIGTRNHFRGEVENGSFVRFYHPRDSVSRWNGYFRISPPVGIPDRLSVTLGAPPVGSHDDSAFVVMGTEFRGIAITSGAAVMVEGNHIVNCWIGGPYSSPLDDSVTEPSAPPTLGREERLDPLNALNCRSLIVRNNSFKNVSAGPYWNMGGVSGAVSGNTVSYDSGTGLVTITTAKEHKLWINARVQIAFGTSQPDYDGLRELTAVANTTFQYKTTPGLAIGPSGSPSYRVVSGVDFLTIEGNIIELADLDSTEFAIKEYPLPANPAAQTYRPFGIIVSDNGLSTLAGPYAHRQVMIRNNKIRYLNGNLEPTVAGLGYPAGAAMQLAGIKELHVTHNVIDVNSTPASRTYRCGMVRFFHNIRPDGELRRGWRGDTSGFYDEPEALVEDAFVLSMLQTRIR